MGTLTNNPFATGATEACLWLASDPELFKALVNSKPQPKAELCVRDDLDEENSPRAALTWSDLSNIPVIEAQVG